MISIFTDGMINSLLRRNAIYLKEDSWDDYGYHTTYEFYYYDMQGNVLLHDYIQVYNKKMEEKALVGRTYVRDFIPEEIIQLDENFCSIGRNIGFYQKLKNLLPNDYVNILQRLNDLAYDDILWEAFKNCKGVQLSLFRSSSTAKVRVEAKKLFSVNNLIQNKLSFEYQIQLPYSCSELKMVFNFEKMDEIPYRINAIVGKNGTGKTQILNHLAQNLSGFIEKDKKDSGFEVEELLKAFPRGERPAFDKVVSISYSVFDPFDKRTGKDALNSYVYCGIQSKDGVLDFSAIKKKFLEAFDKVKNRDRVAIWKVMMQELFRDSSNDIINRISEGDIENIRWSSGQNIIILSMTEVIANIEKESIILFDEPEIHLHPNAISNIMRMLLLILNEFDSYAIIATHSPIILQEIPSDKIIVLERIDDQAFVRKPEIECFGENISQIIREIFNVTADESCYQNVFMNLKKKGIGKESIEAMFNNSLGISATMYLDSLYVNQGLYD